MVKKREIHFCDFAREKRIGKGLGQRELARWLGISASYLNDIEKKDAFRPLIVFDDS